MVIGNGAGTAGRAVRVLVGYDGSPAANAAIDAGALLLPRAYARVLHLWTPPFASEGLRKRLWSGTEHVNDFVEAVHREGEWAARRIAAVGVTLARAAGWDAEPMVRRSYGGEGMELAGLVREVSADVVLVGSRGLGGASAVLGSVSDMVVHFSPAPVLVVPQPLLMDDHAALSDGPVLIGWDGSAGAHAALAAALRLFPTREVLLASVADHTSGEATTTPPGERTLIPLHLEGRHVGSSRSVADALTVCARDHKAAALVVGSRGRSAVKEILLGSVAMASLHHADRPVLVVPAPARND